MLLQSDPFSWTNLLPVVHETGLGDFCIPDFKAPAEFVGHSGLLQIMQGWRRRGCCTRHSEPESLSQLLICLS